MERRSKPLQTRVGESWPGEIKATVERRENRRRETRDWASIGLIGLFGSLLVTFTAYGMVYPNEAYLKDAWELVRYGLVAALGWAFGRSTLPT